MADSAPVKKIKRQGPIRWEAVIPLLVVVGAIWLYGFFFLDLHLRKAIEKFGSRAAGAEVDVASLRTSFWSASLEIRGVEVTDADAPDRNLVQIGRIHWRMLWDALLRGKIAIDDASIDDIALAVARRERGFVLPKPPPPKESAMEKLKTRALDEAQKEFDQNILGDVASLLKGNDPAAQLASIQTNLKSSARIKELEVDLAAKQKQWQERVAKLPQTKDLQALDSRIKKVKLSGFANPSEVQTSLQELNGIFNDANARFNEVKATGDALNADIVAYQTSLKDLEGMIKSDVRDLESRIKLPKIDAQSLSRMLFGPQLLAKVRKAEFYVAKARQYMPPKKTNAQLADEKAAAAAAIETPRSRSGGRTYQFGRPYAYPLFWLKHASIGSKASPGGLSGDVKGTLTDVTTDQSTIGRATVARFEGEFPAQDLHGLVGEITVDHLADLPIERLSATIGSIGVAARSLVSSPDVNFGFAKASSATSLKAEIAGPKLDIRVAGAFDKIEYLVDTKEPVLTAMLRGAVAEVPKVTYEASAAGPWSDLKFAVDTNLGRDLAKALERQIQAKIAQARAQLQKLIDERIGAEKAKLMAQFKQAQDQILGAIKGKEAEIDKAKKQIESAKNDALKSQTKGLEEQGKKTVEDLKKKFGF